MRRQVNLLVIGRAPRRDLESEFRRVLGDRCHLRTIGALDELSEAQIAAQPPRSDADTLFTILPDGRSTLLSKALVTDALRDRLAARPTGHGQIDVLCCTGAFPEFGDTPIITASNVLAHLARGLGTFIRNPGVFIPKPQQVETAAARWKTHGIDASVVALAPDASDDEIDAAAQRMRQHLPDLMIFDCISYSHATRIRVQQTLEVPSIVASNAMAHTVAELLGL